MQTLEKIQKIEKVKTYPRNLSNFVYNLIALEEKLRANEKSGEDLADMLYKCYQFIRNNYFDYELKKQNSGIDILAFFAKSLHNANLCKTLKSLLLEILTMIKHRLGKLISANAENEFFDSIELLVFFNNRQMF